MENKHRPRLDVRQKFAHKEADSTQKHENNLSPWMVSTAVHPGVEEIAPCASPEARDNRLTTGLAIALVLKAAAHDKDHSSSRRWSIFSARSCE